MAEKRETPPKYKQPVTEFVGRNLTGSLEQIDYSPKSHIRIWYNNQVEGYATHHHTAMEMILCIENTYTVIANNKTYHLNVGDILLIPPNMLHKIICQEEGTRFIFLVNIDSFSNLEDYHNGDYFDLLNACFTSSRPQLHSSYINPEEAGRLRQLMRMNYETMHLFGMSRAERTRCLTIMNDYYRLHLPDFPALKSLDVLKELFD